jgi:hypothetical protein
MGVDDATRERPLFEHRDLRRAHFRMVDLSGARIDQADMSGVVMRGVELVDVEISGEIRNVTINGVEVGAFVEAELDKLHPDRAAMRPAHPEGFRQAWAVVEQLWAETVSRAEGLDPELLHESVEGEWSFIETLRHLVFATDAWIRRAVLGDPRPWHPLDLPWDAMEAHPDVPWDRDARPSLREVLVLRADRMATVRHYLAELTEESLNAQTEPVPGPGWPPPVSFPVKECLLVVLNEEWLHRQFAERDLAVLAARHRGMTS